MRYRRLTTREEISAGIGLWNREHVGFEIIPRLAEQNIFAPFAGVHSVAWGGFRGDELVAFTLVKYLSQGIPGSADESWGWVSLLVVDQELRRDGSTAARDSSSVAESTATGCGESDENKPAEPWLEILRYAEEDLLQRGVKKIRFGGDPQNFLPGLPKKLVADYLPALEKMGYQAKGQEYDLYGDLTQYSPLARVKSLEEEAGQELEARPVTKEEEGALLEFLQAHFPGRWYYEADQIRRVPGGVEDYWLLWKGATAVGFVRTNRSDSVYLGPNVNWGNRYGDRYCGLGPIGVDSQYRGQGYGLYLMEMVIRSFQQRGYHQMMIDWTQLVDYYRKIGFEPVIEYTSLLKEIASE